MSAGDRVRWDQRYLTAGATNADLMTLPSVFEPYAEMFPITGNALELACGRGNAGLWLARRGMTVQGLDVSAVAITQARELARTNGLDARCQFDVADLDDGLPPGPLAEVVVCHKFRDARLDRPIVDRLAPCGLLAISALSEIGASAGPFRVASGELNRAFAELELIAAGEGDGLAWLLARQPAVN